MIMLYECVVIDFVAFVNAPNNDEDALNDITAVICCC